MDPGCCWTRSQGSSTPHPPLWARILNHIMHMTLFTLNIADGQQFLTHCICSGPEGKAKLAVRGEVGVRTASLIVL